MPAGSKGVSPGSQNNPALMSMLHSLMGSGGHSYSNEPRTAGAGGGVDAGGNPFPVDTSIRPPGITDRVWDASGHNSVNAQRRMDFEAANGGYTGWGPVGSAAPGFSVDNNLQWNEPILDHGTMAPPGAPRFAGPDGMVRANSYNPLSGYAEDAMLWDPTGLSGTGRIQVSNQQLQNQRNWASVPWQNSWADPNASNFYMTADKLGATPSSYFNPGTWSWGAGQALDNTTGGPAPNAHPGYAPGGYGPLADATYGQQHGGPHGPHGPMGGPPPSGPSPGGGGLDSYWSGLNNMQGLLNQGTPPAATPPAPAAPAGGNGALPPGFAMGPNGQVGNFNMYANMPYAGGMGPYSGWLPPEVGTQVDFGAPGTAPSPQAAASAAPGTYAPGPTVQPGQYANLGPGGNGASNLGMPAGGGTWGTNGAQGWGYW